MNASVCVLVTVPTEQEECRHRPTPSKPCSFSYNNSSYWERISDPTLKGQRRISRALQLTQLEWDAPLEQVLRQIVKELRLEHVFWTHDVDGGQLQVRIDMLQDECYECLLYTLQDWGIGGRPATHVTAINCLETCFRQSSMSGWSGAGPSSASKPYPGRTDVEPVAGSGDSEGQRMGWQNFMDSVRCRLNVNQVVRVVRRDATINFDFVVLLMAAALLSCVGLVDNSFLYLSSSMLISPLMGPIIAGIFGSVIGDSGLRWLGMKNELIGIAISVLTGFVFGGAICLCGLSRFFMVSGGFTEEINSRCDTRSLIIGLCTALASGAAAAIGVLGGNTGSLVGVAISASLLPPAVNAGLLGAIALCCRLMHIDPELRQGLAKHQEYSPHLHVELFVCAMVSMALTLINVVCVWLMGVVVLRIKEVAPAVQRDQHFWRHDVRLAREVAQHDPELHIAIDLLDLDKSRHVDLDAPRYQHTWSPGTLPPPRLRSQLSHCQNNNDNENEHGSSSHNNSNYHTVHGFQDFCITLHKMSSKQPRRSPAVVPSFVEVFKPLEPAAPAIMEPSGEETPSAALAGSYRSLPNLRSDCLPEQHLAEESNASSSKPLRCVRWSWDSSSSQGTLQRPSSQSDRQLRLMISRRQSVETEDADYQDEFDV